MKKLLGVVLLFVSYVTYAGDYACIHLKIKIKNNTPFSCHLVNVQLKHACSEDMQHLPLVIDAGMESLPFIVYQDSVYSALKTTLTYACGPEQSITIQSKQTPCAYYSKTVTGTIVTSNNMDATMDTNNAGYFAGKAGEINWVLH